MALDAEGHGFPEAVAALPADALIKVNAAEAAGLAGAPVDGPAELRAAAATVAARTLVVTLGRDGALAVGPDGGGWRLGAAPVSGHFPVGSGDAFLAGMLAARAAGAGLVSQLRLGAGAAAANTEQPGAGVVDARRAVELSALVPVERLP